MRIHVKSCPSCKSRLTRIEHAGSLRRNTTHAGVHNLIRRLTTVRASARPHSPFPPPRAGVIGGRRRYRRRRVRVNRRQSSGTGPESEPRNRNPVNSRRKWPSSVFDSVRRRRNTDGSLSCTIIGAQRDARYTVFAPRP